MRRLTFVSLKCISRLMKGTNRASICLSRKDDMLANVNRATAYQAYPRDSFVSDIVTIRVIKASNEKPGFPIRI